MIEDNDDGNAILIETEESRLRAREGEAAEYPEIKIE